MEPNAEQKRLLRRAGVRRNAFTQVNISVNHLEGVNARVIPRVVS